jgi:hypothetical protein
MHSNLFKSWLRYWISLRVLGVPGRNAGKVNWTDLFEIRKGPPSNESQIGVWEECSQYIATFTYELSLDHDAARHCVFVAQSPHVFDDSKLPCLNLAQLGVG